MTNDQTQEELTARYEQRKQAEIQDLAFKRELAYEVGTRLGAIAEASDSGPWERYARFTFAVSPLTLVIRFDNGDEKLTVSARFADIHNAKGERVDLKWRFDKITAPQRTEAKIAISKGATKIALEVHRRVLTPMLRGLDEYNAIKAETAQTDNLFARNVETISQAVNGRSASKHELNGYQIGDHYFNVTVSKYGKCTVEKIELRDLDIAEAQHLINVVKELQRVRKVKAEMR
jgi:hypothetical protein